MTRDMDDKFVKSGIQMAVDGTDPELIEQVLTNELEAVAERHMQGKALFDNIGKYAPAFGMIGTLVGLVQMLSTMDDPSTIGPAMAVALLTTLYGALIANLVALPIAEKLEEKAEQQRLNRSLIIEAVMEIEAKRGPDAMAEILQVYLPEKQRVHDESGAEERRVAASKA